MQLRNLVIMCAVFVVVLGGFVLWSQYGRMPGEGGVSVPVAPEGKQQEGLGPIVVTAPAGVGEKDEAGNWLWEAEFAGELHVDQKAGTVSGGQVTCTIPVQEKQTLVVTAGKFSADQGSRKLRFEEEARADLKPTGSYFLAKGFEWDIESRRLSARGGVELSHQHVRIRGDSLEADLGAQKARVSGHARATYQG